MFGETKMQDCLNDYQPIMGELSKALKQSFDIDSLIHHLITFDQRFIYSISQMESITPAILGYFKKFADIELGQHICFDHVLRKLVKNHKTNPDVLDVIVRSRSAVKTYELIQNDSIRTDSLDHLVGVLLASGEFDESGIAESISKHPNASDWALRKAIEICELKESTYLEVAKHQNSSSELLAELSLIESGKLNKTINYSTGSRYGSYGSYGSYSSSNTSVDNSNLRECLAGNPNTPKSSLRAMFEAGDSRDVIVIHPSISIEEAFDWLQDPDLTIDENGCISGEGRAISKEDAGKCLDAMLKKYAGKSVLPVLMESKHALNTLFEMGYNLKELVSYKKIKAFVRACINSTHKEEVAFLLRGMTCNEDESIDKKVDARHLGLSALSAIQGLFTKSQKMDRHNYLLFMAWLNEHNIFPSAFECAANTLMDVEKTIGLDGIKSVLIEQNALHFKRATASRDTFLFISELVSHDEPEAVEKQIKLINRWLAKAGNTHDELFHDYLMNKCKRDFGREIVPANFYQMRFISKAEVINKELKEGDFNYRIYLPKNTAQLATIGNVQRHCVGSSFYANNCVNGHNIIFAIKIDGTLKHGYTFQFDTNTGALLQAEGFCRSEVPDEYVKLAKDWITKLTGNN